MPQRADVLRAARSLIGVPFVHQGRLRETGTDCVGLVILIARDLGLADDWPELPYRSFPPESMVRDVLETYLTPTAGGPEPGCVALLRWRRTANHIAVIGDAGEPYSLIHSHYGPGRVVEHRADEEWQGRLVALYSYRGVDP